MFNFFKTFHVPLGERAVLLDAGRPILALGPGKHRFRGADKELWRFKVDELTFTAPVEVREVLPPDWFAEASLGPQQRGVLFRDERPVRYLRPGLGPAAMVRVGALAAAGAGALAMLMAWRMRDIIDILQLGFTINAAGLFLPTLLAICDRRVPAAAAFWSTAASLLVVIAWRAAAGAGGIFALDPLWPGLAVSAILLFVLSVRPR